MLTRRRFHDMKIDVFSSEYFIHQASAVSEASDSTKQKKLEDQLFFLSKLTAVSKAIATDPFVMKRFSDLDDKIAEGMNDATTLADELLAKREIEHIISDRFKEATELLTTMLALHHRVHKRHNLLRIFKANAILLKEIIEP